MGDRGHIYRIFRSGAIGRLDDIEIPYFIENFKKIVNTSAMEQLYDMVDNHGQVHVIRNVLLSPHENVQHEIRIIEKEELYYAWIRLVK